MSTPDSIPDPATTETAAPLPLRNEFPGFPSWSWTDLVGISGIAVLVLLASFLLSGFMVFLASSDRAHLDPKSGKMILAGIAAQAVAYCIVLLYIRRILRLRSGKTAHEAVEWTSNLLSLATGAMGGITLAVAIMYLSRFVTLPEQLPIEDVFKVVLQSPWTTCLFATFSILLAPLFEEVYFRGLLFPLLQRSLGSLAAILITAVAFALIHALQLAFSGKALLLMTFVGIVLTVIRARMRSVCASWTAHVLYNTTLLGVSWFASSHFK